MTRAVDPLIDIQLDGRLARVPNVGQFVTWTQAALTVTTDPPAPMCVKVVGEAEGRRLNKRYRGIDRATNVLSFSTDLDGLPPALPPGLRPLGDLLLCASVVAREADEQHKPADHHWAHMVVHGVLHLLGYDHETEDEAREMESREIDVLQRLGIPNPYVPRTAVAKSNDR